MSKNSNERAPQGRPVKMSLDDKKTILHKFFIHVNPKAYSETRLHGIFTKLADFAQQDGFETAEGYDFANDEKFRAYLSDYLSAERYRSHPQQSVGFAFEPLDIRRALGLNERELQEVLQQRESYFSKLYDSSIKACDHYMTLENENRTLRDDNQHLTQEITSYVSKIEALEQVILELKRTVQAAKEDAIYWQARAKDVISAEAQAASKSPASLLDGYTRFGSLVSKDLEMRKASVDSPTVISFMDKLEEKLKERTNDEQ